MVGAVTRNTVPVNAASITLGKMHGGCKSCNSPEKLSRRQLINTRKGSQMQANILVIDDEESIRFSFHRFVSGEGYRVITAEKYLEALSEMDAMEFDLILTDIILEDGCGMDILREVMKRNLKTRVIIMTAYPTTETEDASRRMQAVNYLTKPLRQKGLLYSIDLALQTCPPRQAREEVKSKLCPASYSRNGCTITPQYSNANH